MGGRSQLQRAISCCRRLLQWRQYPLKRRSALRMTMMLTKTSGATNAESALKAMSRGPPDLFPDPSIGQLCYTVAVRAH
jgi:hypothetical protein